MSDKLKKYTVITGASAGIGHEAAKAFAVLGKNLILVARRNTALEKLKGEILTQHPDLDIAIKTADLSFIQNVHTLYAELAEYKLETWINNAGMGDYASVADQNLNKIEKMLHLNIAALTILSSLFVADYQYVKGTQLINISSRGGYIIVPNAVTYCATKFYVSAFTEGLAQELREKHAEMQVKVLAPAATQTEFGKIANDVHEYNYDKAFAKYHTAKQMAEFLVQLYKSDKTVGLVDWESFSFLLRDPIFSYAGNSKHNQKMSQLI